MKRNLKNALKPQKSFEEWAKENRVEINEYTPITRMQRFSSWMRQRKVIAGLSSVMACCIILVAILVPALLSNEPEPVTPPTSKVYTAQDAVSESIEIEELYQIDNLLLFDFEQIIKHVRINKDLAIDNEDLILSYTIYEELVLTKDEANAFWIDYRILTYHDYDFFGCEKYSILSQSFMINNVEIEYEIHEESRNDKKANLSFSYDNYDYFLEIKGFEDVTDITEEALKILLNDLFD